MQTREIARSVVTHFATICFALFLSSCGNNGNGNGNAAAEVALSQPNFKAPIFLSVPPDQSGVASMLSRLHGTQDEDKVDSHPVLNLCIGRSVPPALSLENYHARPQSGALFKFMVSAGYARVQSYRLNIIRNQVTGTNPDGSPHIWSYAVPPRSYECFVLTKKIAPFLGGGNFHRGGKVELGRRVFSKWTYRKSYRTDIPGKGNVKIFAGTFDYSVESKFTGVTFDGLGTVAVKLWLDPDSGHWIVANWNYQKSPTIHFSGSVG